MTLYVPWQKAEKGTRTTSSPLAEVPFLALPEEIDLTVKNIMLD